MKFKHFDRRAHLARRPWTPRERAVVGNGLLGRVAIAVEPLLGTIFFSCFTWGIILRARHTEASLIVIAPIFALAALAFTVYAICLLVAPVTAFINTYKPIYIVDGYVRYRGPDGFSDVGSTGYVAVLDEQKSSICEWEAFGMEPLPERTIASLAEFSPYGGIHKIDGKATGVVPEKMTPLGIGIAPRGNVSR